MKLRQVTGSFLGRVQTTLIARLAAPYDLDTIDPDSDLADFVRLHADLRAGAERVSGRLSAAHTLLVGPTQSELIDDAPDALSRMAKRRSPVLGAAQYDRGRVMVSPTDAAVIVAGLSGGRPDDPFDLWNRLRRNLHEHFHGVLDDGKDHAGDPLWMAAWREGLTELSTQVFAMEIFDGAGFTERQPLLGPHVDPPSYPEFTSAVAVIVNVASQLSGAPPRHLLANMLAAGGYASSLSVLSQRVAAAVPDESRDAVAAGVRDAIREALAPLAETKYRTPAPEGPASVAPGSVRTDFRAGTSRGHEAATRFVAAVEAAAPGAVGDVDLRIAYAPFAAFEPGRDLDTVAREYQPTIFQFEFANGYSITVPRETMALARDGAPFLQVLLDLQELPPAATPRTVTVAEAPQLVRTQPPAGAGIA